MDSVVDRFYLFMTGAIHVLGTSTTHGQVVAKLWPAMHRVKLTIGKK
jgi:hypothetical protein